MCGGDAVQVGIALGYIVLGQIAAAVDWSTAFYVEVWDSAS